jgi:hypothetical protein
MYGQVPRGIARNPWSLRRRIIVVGEPALPIAVSLSSEGGSSLRERVTKGSSCTGYSLIAQQPTMLLHVGQARHINKAMSGTRLSMVKEIPLI